jgi:hypothetical protein
MGVALGSLGRYTRRQPKMRCALTLDFRCPFMGLLNPTFDRFAAAIDCGVISVGPLFYWSF